MSDGIRLAARLWLPQGAESEPVPVILEYIPYRRRDGTRAGDELTHPWLAARGYACVRLDIRGTGDSEGLILDEYLVQEQDDAVEAISWLAAQPWCNGNVGMMGISWGGFNSLQVAARRPPALKAIVTVCSTDDRYADDMHYMGGCLMTGNLEWGSSFFSIMARAPDPHVVGDGWRDMWLARLEAMTPVYGTWLEHQRRDAYWQHGSVCEDFSAITCAVMAVGGWADGYTNAVFRLLSGLTAPRLGLVGPWGHKYPHNGVPGPAIGFLTEITRWWDHWLKDRDTGILAEPMLRAFIQDSVPPCAHYAERPGRWVAEPNWPSETIAPAHFRLNTDGLGTTPKPGPALSISSPQTTGAAGGEWCPYGLGGIGPENPTDQRMDDAHSLVFDGAPLDAPLEILGAAELTLDLASNKPVAQITARLNDVAPDGSVTRVTYGVLNLTHRAGHAAPEPLEPGKRYNVRLKLNDVGYRFAAGHRVRVALSTAYWPIIWPAPEATTLSVAPGSSSLSLPVRAARSEDRAVNFGPAERPTPMRGRVVAPGAVKRTVQLDIETGTQTIDVLRDDGSSEIEEIGVATAFHKILTYRLSPDDPATARAQTAYDIVHRHIDGGWNTRIRTRSAIACTVGEFIVEGDIEAFDGDRRIFSRSWTRRISRDLV